MAVVADANGILDNIASLLASNNTTTSSVLDLSDGLESRVKKVLSVHPLMLNPGADVVPFVTSYITKKSIEDQTIAKNKLSIQRQGLFNIEVVGCVWNSDFNSIGEDPADVEVHSLMENVEYLLRTDDTLSGKVSWHSPREVNYYDEKFDEQTHLRVGIITLEAKVYY